MTETLQDPQEYVTVAEFMDAISAQMAKGALESAGIECFLEGEHGNNLLGPAFWAHLQVHRQDEEAAREILDAAEVEPDKADASEARLSTSDTTDEQDNEA